MSQLFLEGGTGGEARMQELLELSEASAELILFQDKKGEVW
jgi:hypothetical protein